MRKGPQIALSEKSAPDPLWGLAITAGVSREPISQSELPDGAEDKPCRITRSTISRDNWGVGLAELAGAVGADSLATTVLPETTRSTATGAS